MLGDVIHVIIARRIGERLQKRNERRVSKLSRSIENSNADRILREFSSHEAKRRFAITFGKRLDRFAPDVLIVVISRTKQCLPNFVRVWAMMAEQHRRPVTIGTIFVPRQRNEKLQIG